MARACLANVSLFPIPETLLPVSCFLFSRCKLCLRYTAGNFNENPSMRALAKILRARASEHSSNFCEQFEQRPNFWSTFKLDGTIRYPLTCTKGQKNKGHQLSEKQHSARSYETKFRRLQLPILQQRIISCHIVKGAAKAPACCGPF